MKANPITLLGLLSDLLKRVVEVVAWVGEHDKPFEIAVPPHLGPTVGPRDREGCQTSLPPKDTRACQGVPTDDQALVEVLWLVEDAMERERSGRRRPASKAKRRKS